LTRAWQALGRVEEAADPQQALAAYAEAAKLSPKDPQPHLAAATLLRKQNDLDAAGPRVSNCGGTRPNFERRSLRAYRRLRRPEKIL
jgi:hypothetical protein